MVVMSTWTRSSSTDSTATAIPTETPPPPLQSASYVYDGNMVKGVGISLRSEAEYPRSAVQGAILNWI